MDDKQSESPFTIFLSIIIPVHNEIRNVGNIIRNIEDLGGDNFEVIIIDDHSSDNTIAKLKSASLKCQVEFLSVANNHSGVSAARNVGLKHAGGEYITFLDADDQIPPDLVAKYKMVTEKNTYDVIMGRFEESEIWKKEKFNLTFVEPQIVQQLILGYPLKQGNPDIDYELKRAAHGCYAKIYKNTFLQENEIHFIEGLGLGEDLLFFLNAASKCKHIVAFNQGVYHIYTNQFSSTNRYNPNMVKYAVEFAKQVSKINYSRDEELQLARSYQINQHVNKSISSYFVHSDNPSSLWEKQNKLKEILSIREIENSYMMLLKNEKNYRRKIKYYLCAKAYALPYFLLARFYRI